MKSFLLASTLLIGSAAFAQTTTPTDPGQASTPDATTQPGNTTEMPAPTQDPAATTPPAGANTMSTDQTGASGTMTDQTGAAQGSMGSQGSMGTMSGTTGAGTMSTQAGNMTPPPEPRASYPRCSRTITDNCVQDESRTRNTRRPRR